MKENFKDVEIGGRKFRIKKFDALTGSYILYVILTQALPMGMGASIPGLADATAGVSLTPMSKQKFIEIQMDCLRACSEILPVGDTIAPVPVLMEDGRWGAPGLEDDIVLVISLTIQALGYNAQSFFDVNALGNLKQTISQLNFFSAKT